MSGRVGAGQLVALAAAAALLLFMAMDWYSTKQGEEARRIQETAEGSGERSGEVRRSVEEQARTFAEAQEKNAWQADGGIDRVILIVLLAAAGLTFVTVTLGAAGRDTLKPGALGVAATMAGALLLSYRLLQEPGTDSITTVKAGAPLALVALGLMALGVALSMRVGEPVEREPERAAAG